MNPETYAKQTVDRYMQLLKAARFRRKIRPLGVVSLVLFAAGFIAGLWSPHWGYYTFCLAAFCYAVYAFFLLCAREYAKDHLKEE